MIKELATIIKRRLPRCCICGKPYTGYGHNAQPLYQGRCCGDCNDRVIAARMRGIEGDR